MAEGLRDSPGDRLIVKMYNPHTREDLRLIRFERCLVLFAAAQHDLDRLILAPEAVVTTATAQFCADGMSLTCQKTHDAEGQH
jgi:hypothetical protein